MTNSTFLGPIDLALNSQYNALIGGRGTGKSSILEYLRWGLCDQPLGEDTDSEVPNYQRRRARLINGTLVPVQGKVELRYSLHDTPHILRRDSVLKTLELKIGSAAFEFVSEEQVRGLLPIQAYSQKQLSDVSVRLDELIRFVTNPINEQLAAIDSRLEEQAAIVRERYSARERRRALEASRTQRQLAQASLGQQAVEIRSRLTGLSEHDRRLIDDAPHYQQAERLVASWASGLDSAVTVVRELRQRIAATKASTRTTPAQPEAPELRRIEAEVVETLSTCLAVLGQAEVTLSQAIGLVDATTGAWGEWTKRHSDFNALYNSASERSTAHAQRLKDLASIESHIAEQQAEIDRLDAEMVTLSEATAQAEAARESINSLRQDRSELLSDRCRQLTERSKGLLAPR